MDYSLPVSSVHGISQAKMLEWVAISFSTGSSNPGIEPTSPALAGRYYAPEPPGKPKNVYSCYQWLSHHWMLGTWGGDKFPEFQLAADSLDLQINWWRRASHRESHPHLELIYMQRFLTQNQMLMHSWDEALGDLRMGWRCFTLGRGVNHQKP